ncbi:MAG TPA: hypothetical protein VMV09_04975 [Candidatus Saccharimonadales bacterium]|nr:hypothetical protein [Candidatus Saccharimonadales bacterium]
MLIALNLHAGERQIRVNAEATTEAAERPMAELPWDGGKETGWEVDLSLFK